MQYDIWNNFRNVFPLHLFGLPLCIHDSAVHNCYRSLLETFTPCILWYFIQHWKQNGLNDKSRHLESVGKLSLILPSTLPLPRKCSTQPFFVWKHYSFTKVNHENVYVSNQIIETRTVDISCLNFLFNNKKKKKEGIFKRWSLENACVFLLQPLSAPSPVLALDLPSEPEPLPHIMSYGQALLSFPRLRNARERSPFADLCFFSHFYPLNLNYTTEDF